MKHQMIAAQVALSALVIGPGAALATNADPAVLRTAAATPLGRAPVKPMPVPSSAASRAADAAANASSAAAPCGRVELAPVVQIPVGKSTVIKPPNPIARILLGNPENARAARPAETPAQNSKEEGVAKAPAIDSRPGVADVDVLLLGPSEVCG